MSSAPTPTRRKSNIGVAIAVGIASWVADLGDLLIGWLARLGDIAIFSFRTVVWIFARLPRRETLLPAFYQVGVLSLPVVAITGTFIGMVLAVQSYDQFA